VEEQAVLLLVAPAGREQQAILETTLFLVHLHQPEAVVVAEGRKQAQTVVLVVVVGLLHLALEVVIHQALRLLKVIMAVLPLMWENNLALEAVVVLEQ
jgi:hypothetical protein